MIGKKSPEILITPEEIVEICDRAGTVDSIDVASAIEKAFKGHKGSTDVRKDEWLYYELLGTIYDAGRIQGIREQRKSTSEEVIL